MVEEVRGFRFGDKVRVDGEIVRFDEPGIAVLQCSPGYRLDVHVSYITLVERPDPPPKVGDRIVPRGGKSRVSGEATIKGIDGENWWIQWDSGSYQTVRSGEFIAEQMYRRVPA